MEALSTSACWQPRVKAARIALPSRLRVTLHQNCAQNEPEQGVEFISIGFSLSRAAHVCCPFDDSRLTLVPCLSLCLFRRSSQARRLICIFGNLQQKKRNVSSLLQVATKSVSLPLFLSCLCMQHQLCACDNLANCPANFAHCQSSTHNLGQTEAANRSRLCFPISIL